MKRGKPLQRKTPLKGSSLSRKGRLSASKPMPRRRPTVTAEEREARALVRARSGGICELCCKAQATNFQHRQNRSQSGKWSADNGLDVCGSGTTGCHGDIHANPKMAREFGYTVPSHADPAETPVWLARHSWVYLTPDGGVTPTTRKDVA